MFELKCFKDIKNLWAKTQETEGKVHHLINYQRSSQYRGHINKRDQDRQDDHDRWVFIYKLLIWYIKVNNHHYQDIIQTSLSLIIKCDFKCA